MRGSDDDAVSDCVQENDYVGVLALAPGVQRKVLFSFDILLLFCLFVVL